MNRRQLIRMTDAEIEAYIAGERTMTCATIGPNGRPHLAPLWFVPAGAHLWGWTYAAAQKTRNLHRCPQATLQIESGEAYGELRGVTMECDVDLVTDPARVREIGTALVVRYTVGDGAAASPELAAAVERQAAKRVGLVFRPTRTVSWDHRKLGGTY